MKNLIDNLATRKQYGMKQHVLDKFFLKDATIVWKYRLFTPFLRLRRHGFTFSVLSVFELKFLFFRN